MSQRFLALACISAIAGLLTGTGVSSAHSECSVTSDSVLQVDTWKGDEHDQLCDAIGGKDSMYGYALNDDLTGGTGDDKLRGATGTDTLREGKSDGDEDLFCDGDGWDTINMADSDTADHFHQVQDNSNETINLTNGDTFHADGSLHSDCPM